MDTSKIAKDQLVSLIAEKTGHTKKLSAELLDAVFDVIVEQVVAGNEVPVHRFGKFSLATRSVFEGKPGASNRAKGTRQVVRWKMSQPLKAMLNG
jgi:integration host factor subunit alpha